MKLTVNNKNQKGQKVQLRVVDTNQEYRYFYFPVEHVEYWYPFNINFLYKYAHAGGSLYLVMEKGYTGSNIYNADILKRSVKLNIRDGTMLHPYVYERNTYIIEKAKQIEVPDITNIHNLSKKDVQSGFYKIDTFVTLLKDQVRDRINVDTYEDIEGNDVSTEEQDENLYKNMTKEELNFLQELGEMYSMLTVMRKIVKSGAIH